MAIVVVLVGLVIGYFLNIIIFSFSALISNTENTEKNINLLDYKILRKYNKYTIRNIIVILISSLLFLISFLQIGQNVIFIKALVLTSVLIVVSFIDIEYQIIPNKIIAFTLIMGIMFSFIDNISFMNAVLGMLLGGGILLVLALVPGALGGGDIKFMFALGIFLGVKGVLFALFLAFIIAAIISVLLLLFKIKKRKDYIPFGPFLALGSFIAFHFF